MEAPSQHEIATNVARLIIDGRAFTEIDKWEDIGVYGQQRITDEIPGRAAKLLEEWGQGAAAQVMRTKLATGRGATATG